MILWEALNKRQLKMRHSSRGSEWHRWDLHLHTPFTQLSDNFKLESKDDDVWNKYIDILENSNVQAFGITDYFSCDNYFTLLDKYEKRYPCTNKIFFLNVEFRLSEIIAKKDEKPHLHVIFDNEEINCSRKKIEEFLLLLKTIGTDDSDVGISCSALATKNQFESASVSFTDVKKALKETFGVNKKPYFLVFPAKNNGILSTDSKSPRKEQISDTIDKGCDFFFGNADSIDWFLKTDRYREGKSKQKPVVSGCDAHSFEDLERLDGHVANFPATWIKSDLTFRGLEQICHEPDSRVFIGLEVPVGLRQASEPTKFISRLKINQIEGYDENNGEWFKGTDLPINPELTAIIGNKGSGKSALVDIIGLLGETRQSKYFSFLSNEPRNKKFKQPGFAENFEAQLVWESANISSKILSDDVDMTEKEKVRYLPQNYFEQLTNDLEIDAFRQEIEDVVFSHVEETDRMGKESFKDLEEFKTQQSKQDTSLIKARLRELNIEIIELEEQANPLTLKKIENELKAKKEELKSLIEPEKVKKPSEETTEQKKLSDEILILSNQLAELKKSEEKKVEEVSQKKNRLQKFITLQEGLQRLTLHVSNSKLELELLCHELELNIDSLIKVDIDSNIVTEKVTELKEEIKKLETDSHIEFSENSKFDSLVSLPDIRSAYSFVEDGINALKEELGTPQRKYQSYIESLSKWNDDKLKITGEIDRPGVDTIIGLEIKIDYINNELSKKISEKSEDRKMLVKEIFNSKEKVLSFYSNLKESIGKKLSSVRTEEFDVEIEAAFVLDNTFKESFLKQINQGVSGPFMGVVNGKTELQGLLDIVEWNDFNSVFEFIKNVIKKMREDHEGKPLTLIKQVSNIKQFNDFLFSLDYFSAKYELRLGGKNLNELSPGEKGMLLLVFYLQLDKDNIPLVIDQPEDNLDNDSIFAVLATCIREAKKNRQVILVTHNPNLAVGADAEQIIYVKLDKAINYKFSCESGSIENPEINKKIVKVLEGSQPAFVKRRLKYHI